MSDNVTWALKGAKRSKTHFPTCSGHFLIFSKKAKPFFNTISIPLQEGNPIFETIQVPFQEGKAIFLILETFVPPLFCKFRSSLPPQFEGFRTPNVLLPSCRGGPSKAKKSSEQHSDYLQKHPFGSRKGFKENFKERGREREGV